MVRVKSCSVNDGDAASSTSHQHVISLFLQRGAHAGSGDKNRKLLVASVLPHSHCDKHAIYFLITLSLIYHVLKRQLITPRIRIIIRLIKYCWLVTAQMTLK